MPRTPEPKNLVVAGKPGVGKTTLVKELAWPHRAEVGGFYTEELVEDGARLGFRLRTFSDGEGLLASKRLSGPPRVGKYGVDLSVLDRLAVPALKKARAEKSLVVIDEIGSMETLSSAFRAEVLECFSGPKPVLATIRWGAQPFTDEVKALPGTELVELTRANYPERHDEVRAWLESRLGGSV
jgi:nucleoside-triphosphatase